MCVFSCVLSFVIPWSVAHQAPLSMGFPRQVNWSGLPIPSPGDLPKPGIEPVSPALQADSSPSGPPHGSVYRPMLLSQFVSLFYSDASVLETSPETGPGLLIAERSFCQS